MGVPLTYTRPKHVASSNRSSRESLAESQKSEGSVKSGNSGSSYSGIPESLAFDKIVNGGTCPVSGPRHTQALSFLRLSSTLTHAHS